uniref:uncharacterized protein isoform X3 n=1 Tax=Myxine glutinosa TaxID=7769 RepID=UPI00358E3C23
MPKSCACSSCTNRSNQKKDVSFHSVPQDLGTRRAVVLQKTTICKIAESVQLVISCGTPLKHLEDVPALFVPLVPLWSIQTIRAVAADARIALKLQVLRSRPPAMEHMTECVAAWLGHSKTVITRSVTTAKPAMVRKV